MNNDDFFNDIYADCINDQEEFKEYEGEFPDYDEFVVQDVEHQKRTDYSEQTIVNNDERTISEAIIEPTATLDTRGTVKETSDFDPSDEDDQEIITEKVFAPSKGSMYPMVDKITYIFERYDKQTTTWRNDEDFSNQQQNVMRAKSWKSRAITYNANNDETNKNTHETGTLMKAYATLSKFNAMFNSTSTRTTSDTQLLQFQPQRTKNYSTHQTTKGLRMSRHPAAGTTCIPMTLCDGTRVYIPKSKSTMIGAKNDKETSSKFTLPEKTTKNLLLLGESMDVLLRRVKNHLRLKELDQIQRRRDTENETIDNEMVGDNVHETTIMNKWAQSNTATNHQLWVDKHAPTSFAHLLSEERSNRQVIRALREWDPYVFKRDAPPPPPQSSNHYYHNRQQQQQGSSNNPYNDRQSNLTSNNAKATTITTKKNSSIDKNDNKMKNRNDIRPDVDCRVILLSGPPGVGKTTLAHVIANHCGYRPVEVNGSDERSESTLLDRVIRGMESTTLDNMVVHPKGNNKKYRPNCLILDEIDGVDSKGTIEALVAIIKADIHRTDDRKRKSNTTSKSSSSSGSSTTVPYLRRPIIFICNNKYTPALKSLLPYCRHQFTIPSPDLNRLVNRLRDVLLAEKVTLNGTLGFGSATSSSDTTARSTMQLLNQLVTSACGDIRSCLYTLQFASASARHQKSTVPTASDTSSDNRTKNNKVVTTDISLALMNLLTGSGLKDERNDFSSLVQRIFRKDKNRHISTTNKNQQQAKMSASVNQVLEKVKNFGEYSRILDSLFLNVLSTSYIDPTMDRCAAVHEWLSSADLYLSNKTTSTDFLMESLHIPTITAAVHLFCRVERQREQDLIYTSRELTDLRYKTESNRLIGEKFRDGLSPQSNVGRSLCTIITETIPYTLWILSAGEGKSALSRAATSMDLLSDGEKHAFQSHVSILHYLSLTYVVDRDDVVATTYCEAHNKALPMKLDPPITNLVYFTKLEQSVDRRPISSSMKEMLCRQVIHHRLLQLSIKNDKAIVTHAKSESTRASDSRQQFVANQKENVGSLGTNKLLNKDPLSTNNSKPIDGSAPLKHMHKTLHTTKDGLLQSNNTTTVSTNFLAIGAKRSKISKSARNASRVAQNCYSTSTGRTLNVDTNNSNNNKSTIDHCSTTNTAGILLSHSGSGVPMQNVVRYKYVKGFTQAVRTPCQIEDLL